MSRAEDFSDGMGALVRSILRASSVGETKSGDKVSIRNRITKRLHTSR
jgi:hypothetical protein